MVEQKNLLVSPPNSHSVDLFLRSPTIQSQGKPAGNRAAPTVNSTAVMVCLAMLMTSVQASAAGS